MERDYSKILKKKFFRMPNKLESPPLKYANKSYIGLGLQQNLQEGAGTNFLFNFKERT